MRTTIIDETRIPVDVPAGEPRRHEPDTATHDINPNDTAPNDIAKRLTGRDYLSYSAVSTYQKCPLRYFFQYVAGLPFEHVASSLIFGGAIHTAIEIHFRALLAGDAPPGLPELLKVYDAAWKSDATAPVQFGKSEDANTLRDLANRMLAAFQASDLSKLDGELLAVEEEFRANVIPGCPDLLGRIDLIVASGNALRIVDFKTSRSAWNETKLQEAAPQQMLYCELAKPLAREYGDRPVRLEWVVLTKTKSPTVQLHTIQPTPGQLVRTKAIVRRVWDSIRAGCFYPAPSAMNCATCPYIRTCREWEG